MTDHQEKQKSSRFVTWLVRAFAVAAVSMVLIGGISCNLSTTHEVIICNTSGQQVQFDKVLVDGEEIWGGPKFIPPYSDSATPWLTGFPNRVTLGFRTSRKSVELKLVTLNQLREPDEASCRLEISSSHCRFEAYYREGFLICTECEDHWD